MSLMQFRATPLFLVDDAGDAGGPFAGGMLLSGTGHRCQRPVAHHQRCGIFGSPQWEAH